MSKCKFKQRGIIILILFITSCLAPVNMLLGVNAASSYTGQAKPMEFYFHHLDTPVSVAGLETKYIMNTTQIFKFLTQQDAHINSFYKPTGLPKIQVDFYLYPNLAGPVTIDGNWQVFMWINGSAYKPTGFSLQFREITVGGTELWDSGLINPTVTSTIGEYIDVPIHSYNLSAPLTHTFSAGATLLVSVEINAGSSADTRIWYDSHLYPSKAIFPCRDYARPISVRTFNANYTETDLFHYNWSQSQRKVIVQANVTDPFGGYDVYHVKMSLLDPSNNSVLENVDMVRVSNDQWPYQYSQVFEMNWSYPETAHRGNYTIEVTVVDNNGYYHKANTGSYTPFIEYNTHIFTIGVVVYYSPTILIVDNEDSPLSNAQVYITWPDGSRDVLPRYTSVNGFINLTHILPADYGFTILWKDVVVNQTILYLESNDTYTIKTEVYQLTVNVQDNGGASIYGAYVMVFKETGVGYGLAVTDEIGQVIFKLPKDNYIIEVDYSAEYWLKIISTSVTEPVSINDPVSTTIALTEFPPPIWTTTGFLLLLGVVLACVVVIIGLFLRYRFFIFRK